VKYILTFLLPAELNQVYKPQIPGTSEISRRIIRLKANVNPLIGDSVFEQLLWLKVPPYLQQQFLMMFILLVVYLFSELLQLSEGKSISLVFFYSLSDKKLIWLVRNVFYLT